MKLQGISKEGLKRIASKVDQASKAPRKVAQQRGGNEYLQTVKAIAEDIKDDYKSFGGEVYDMVHEQVDGNEYIIYYAKNLEVLQNSPNSDAIDDVGMEIDTSKGWQNILTQVAYFAMVQDVMDELENLGYDGEGFGDEDEEIEEEF
jgi:sulfite reductase alpha subunit-like flavoprotein